MPNFENKVKDSISRSDQFQLGLYDDIQVVDSSNITSLTADPGTIYLVDSSSANVDIELFSADDKAKVVTVKKTVTANTVNINTPNSENIDGNPSLSITSQYTSREIIDDGSNYFII